jgi:hypothetical protein
MRGSVLKLALVVIALLTIGTAAMAQDECSAEIRAKYIRPDESANTEFIDHLIAVEVDANRDCAMVSYTLTVVERYPDGEKRTKSKSWTQSFHSGESKTRRVKYRIHRKTAIDSHSIKVVGCRVCGAP